MIFKANFTGQIQVNTVVGASNDMFWDDKEIPRIHTEVKGGSKTSSFGWTKFELNA